MSYSALGRVGPSCSLSGDSCRPWAGMKMESEVHQSQIMLLKLPLTRLRAKGHSSAFVIPPARRSQLFHLPHICSENRLKQFHRSSKPSWKQLKKQVRKIWKFFNNNKKKISKQIQNPTPNSSLKNYLQFHIMKACLLRLLLLWFLLLCLFDFGGLPGSSQR